MWGHFDLDTTFCLQINRFIFICAIFSWNDFIIKDKQSKLGQMTVKVNISADNLDKLIKMFELEGDPTFLVSLGPGTEGLY